MSLIIALWVVLFLDIVRFIYTIRSGVTTVKTQATNKASAAVAGCLVVGVITLMFGITIGVLIWAIVALTNLQ